MFGQVARRQRPGHEVSGQASKLRGNGCVREIAMLPVTVAAGAKDVVAEAPIGLRIADMLPLQRVHGDDLLARVRWLVPEPAEKTEAWAGPHAHDGAVVRQ